MAAAEASLRTWMVSMSFGEKSRMVVPIGTPSMTYSGAVLPKLPRPRMRTDGSAPGWPSDVIWTPATLPSSIVEMLEWETFFISSASTMATEPVRSTFFWEP